MTKHMWWMMLLLNFLTAELAGAQAPDIFIFKGTVRIMEGEGIVFPDGSIQGSATLKGQKGDKGDPGPQGPPAATSVEAICGAIIAANRVLPPFCLTASLATISVTSAQTSLLVNASSPFLAVGTSSDTSTQDLTSQVVWSSSNPAVATVSNQAGSAGMVSAVSPGTALITAASGAVSGHLAVSVTQQFSEYTIPSPNSSPQSLVLGPDGALWFVETAGNRIARMSFDGSARFTEFALPAGSGPSGITAGPDGNLWFTKSQAGKIGRITPSGVSTDFDLPTPNPAPSGITAGPDGNLWFTEYAGKIGRITTAGVVTEFTVPTAGSAPFGIAAGPDGNIWFTETQGNKIGKITPSGVITEFNIPTFQSRPVLISAGFDGNLWFTEADGNNIGKISPDGVLVEYAIPTKNSQPVGISAFPDQSVWFTEATSSKVARITASGVVTEFPTPTGNSGPTDIVYGPNGQIWFLESWANKLVKLSLPEN